MRNRVDFPRIESQKSEQRSIRRRRKRNSNRPRAESELRGNEMMTYNSVDDVFAANDAVRRRLVARVEGLDEGHANASEGGWTVAQIIEHLSIAEPRITDAIIGILAPTESEGGERKPFAHFSLDEYVEQARGRIEAPEFLRPSGLPL